MNYITLTNHHNHAQKLHIFVDKIHAVQDATSTTRTLVHKEGTDAASQEQVATTVSTYVWTGGGEEDCFRVKEDHETVLRMIEACA